MRTSLILLLAFCLSGCAGIGKINGQRMGVTNGPPKTYCEKNPAVCVIGGVAVVGGAAALINHHHKSGGKGATGGSTNR